MAVESFWNCIRTLRTLEELTKTNGEIEFELEGTTTKVLVSLDRDIVSEVAKTN